MCVQMKYIKHTFMLMILTVTLSMLNIDAIGIGAVTVDNLGLYYTSGHQKSTSSLQYASKNSCYGVVSGTNLSVQGRGIKVSDNSGRGNWVNLSSSARELTGERMKTANAQYKLNLKVSNSVESCRFVGNWQIN